MTEPDYPAPTPEQLHGLTKRTRTALRLYLFQRDGFKDKFGTWRAHCAFGCGRIVSWNTSTIDRYPIKGRDGGKYTCGNTRLACEPCNSADRRRHPEDLTKRQRRRFRYNENRTNRYLHGIDPQNL